MEEIEELRDEGQRGTNDGRRELGDPGKALPLARETEGYPRRVHGEEAYVHMPCCRRIKVRSKLWISLTE